MSDTAQLYEMITSLTDRVLALELEASVAQVKHAEHRHPLPVGQHPKLLTGGPVTPEETFSDGTPIPPEPAED